MTANPGTQTSYLDPHTLTSIAPLELRARMVVEGLMTGMHRSPYQGFSVEFAQHRQYTPGDDLRHLDWKVFGRSDKLYLKQHIKETNLDLMLLVDASGSMAYGSEVRGQKSEASGGTWRKFDHAATIAAAIAYLALHQQDRVGLVMFADQIRSLNRPSNARGHWRSIVDALSTEPLDPREALGTKDGGFADRKTDLARMFDQVAAQLTQRSLIVLISDLFDSPEAVERGLARLSHRRHDVIVFQVLDHDELTFDFRAPTQFVGLEAEGRLNLDPAALRKAYLQAINEHIERIESITHRFQFDHLQLDNSKTVGPPLSHFLAKRAAMINRGKS